MKQTFVIRHFDSGSKDIEISGPDTGYSPARILIDNDDVDHAGTRALAEMIVEILNSHWDINKFDELKSKYKRGRSQ